MATVRTPSSCPERKTRVAISLRLATRSLRIGLGEVMSKVPFDERRARRSRRYTALENNVVCREGWRERFGHSAWVVIIHFSPDRDELPNAAHAAKRKIDEEAYRHYPQRG